MTLSKLRYRLMIEGCDTEWVTDPTLAGTDRQGRTRRIGLQYEGLAIEEKLDLREATVDVGGITATIRSEYANEVFGKRAQTVGTMHKLVGEGLKPGNVDYDDTSIMLYSTAGLAVNDVVHMGTEAMLVESVTATAPAIGVQRQYWDTMAQNHYQVVGEAFHYQTITDKPRSLEGRRAYLFRYDETEWSDGEPLFMLGTQASAVTHVEATNTNYGVHEVYWPLSKAVTEGRLMEMRAFAKPAEYSELRLAVSLRDDGESTKVSYAHFNVYTGVVLSTSDDVFWTSITPVGDSGWYFCRMRFLPAATGSENRNAFLILGQSGSQTFTPTIGYGVDVWMPKVLQYPSCTNLVTRKLTAGWVEYNAICDDTSTVPPGDYDGSVQWTTDTLIWRGLIMRQPRFAISPSDGPSWSVGIEPITAVLEQDIAALADDNSLEPIRIRGIYHHWQDAFVIRAYDGDAGDSMVVKLTGHWESQQAFVIDVIVALASIREWLTHSPTSLFILPPAGSPSGKWRVVLRTSATPCKLRLDIYGSLEGSIGTFYWHDPDDLFGQVSCDALSGNTEYTADEGQYKPILEMGFYHPLTNGSIGRARLAAPMVEWEDGAAYLVDEDESSNAPTGRVYYDGPDLSQLAGAGDTVKITWANPDWSHVPQALQGFAFIGRSEGRYTLTDVTADYFQIADLSGNRLDVPSNIPLDVATEMTIYRGVTHGTVEDLVDGLVERSVGANLGDMPFITAADIDFSGLSDYLDQCGELAQRAWAFGNKVSVQDVIKEELKLLGCFMRLGVDGRINAQNLASTAATDVEVVLIGEANIVTPYDSYGAYPSVEPNADGIVNEILVNRQYDSYTDEYLVDPTPYVHIDSIATHKSRGRGSMSIEPKSSETSRPEENGERNLIGAILDWYATDHDVITLAVAMTSTVTLADGTAGVLMTDVRCGTWVRITSAHIPNVSTGTMGVTALTGLVVGRSWPLDPKEHGIGQLIVRCNHVESTRSAGYAPAAYISALSLVTGTTYNLTVSQNKYAPSGHDDLDYFTSGDKVRGCEWNGDHTYTGQVTSIINATTIRVAFDATPTYLVSAGLGLLRFANDGGSLAAGQTDYIYVADSGLLLYDNGQSRRFS